MSAPSADVLVVGGGVIGCALAAELAARGQRVAVVERGEPGAEASSAAAGMLSPQSDAVEPSPFFDFAMESLLLHADWARSLFDETGIDVGYRRTGLYRCLFAETEPGRDSFAWQHDRGLRVETRGVRDLERELEGRLSPEVTAALYFPDEAVVNPRLLARAAWVSAERRGARILSDTAARGVLVEDGECRGILTDAGPIRAGAVVNAAGAWAASIGTADTTVPVFPVRGQIVEVRLEGKPLTAIVSSEEAYVVPRADGTALLGSTAEHVGFRKGVTAGAVRALVTAGTRLLPSLSSARFESAWSGLRPGTPDGLPILGAAALRGLFFAAGHFRNGILLAPATARRMADLIVDRRGAEALAPFSADRFVATPSLL
jgi:glycine oxidase